MYKVVNIVHRILLLGCKEVSSTQKIIVPLRRRFDATADLLQLADFDDAIAIDVGHAERCHFELEMWDARKSKWNH
jgi:hypothetical protein